MRVAVTATGPTLEDEMDPRFGRCSYFILVEPSDRSFEAVENEQGSLGSGAGIQSAQLMAQRGVKAVLTGACGPNAQRALNAAGIEVYPGCSGTVAEVVAQYRAGLLRSTREPSAAGQPMGGH